MTTTAKQGHRYRWYGYDVLALESGTEGWVRVAMLMPGQPWLGPIWPAHVNDLTSQPMRYFHGEVPR